MTYSPPIADQLAIALRAYAVPASRLKSDSGLKHSTSKKKRQNSNVASSPWALVFDTETTTCPAQALRFGTYQLRNAGKLVEAGIFYDPEGVTADELELLQDHADLQGLTICSRESFVDELFYGVAYKFRATIVGFNLPFDISRLAISHGTARTPIGDDTSAMRGGFTFKLSVHKIFPNIRVKHLSRQAALVSFAAPMGQPDPRGVRKRGFKRGVRRGHFVDVKTIAGALLAKSFRLASLCDFLRVPNPKQEFDEFNGPITDEMIGYAMADVQATWECYSILAEQFGALGLTETNLERIYSEAGIGKGYLRQMGIRPWREVQPEVPSDLIAKILGSYFGGRSEVRIRREVRQVILCDFLSMYPTVCTLMGLWRFVIADGMTWRDATAKARNLLATIDLNALQSKAMWRKLPMLVRVLPDADIFPVRASYSREAQATIGANYLTSDQPLWFTLADCIASKLLAGKAPHVLEAIRFEPGLMQAGLRPIDVAGNPDYRVDPTKTDFFQKVIELRQSIKAKMKGSTGEEWTRRDIEQNALKICANSTSYGIWVEVNVETRPERSSMTVHSSTAKPFNFPTDKAEMPGQYFHPLLAALITGAARLMLAIAEKLAIDRGLDWTFCDTDSMAFAKPEDMKSEAFGILVGNIAEWFAPLNPYAFEGSILKVEEVNGALGSGQPEPLHCFAISAKRYALFNLSAGVRPIMRKVSAHGLGHLLPPYGPNDAPAGLPEPHETVLREGAARWHCDLWHQIVCAALVGHPDQVDRDYHPTMERPAISRYSATSPDLLRWFKAYNANRPYRGQVKPFGFMLALRARPGWGGEASIIESPQRGRPPKVKPPKPVSPFSRDPAEAAAMAFDRESGKPGPVTALQSYAEALAQYHLHPEWKFLGGDYLDQGTTQRRHVWVSGIRYIGKESNEWERQAVLGLDIDADPDYGIAEADIANLQQDLTTLAASIGNIKAAKALRIPVNQFSNLLNGQAAIDHATAATLSTRLPAAMQEIEKLCENQRYELQHLHNMVQLNGLREAARQLGVDPSNLRRKLARSG